MKCPGQDSRYWKPGAIFEAKCPKCGEPVEFFKDDATRRCKKCGHRFLNPSMDFGCASYCQYAEQCIGDLPPELIAQRENLLKDRVAVEIKKYLKNDFKRIGHTMRMARYAEQLGKAEEGNLAVILPAAYLHGTGIEEGKKEGDPAVAREILARLGAREELIDEVCRMIAHYYHPGEEETVDSKVLHDAGMIADLEEKQKEGAGESPEKAREVVEESFLTESGKDLAEKILLSGN